MTLPTTTARYTIDFSKGLDGLALEQSSPLPELGANDCLIQVHAVSLNYRDIAMPLGLYPAKFNNHVVPTSDCAGLVLAVGSSVTEFKAGDAVCNTFFLDYEDGYISAAARQTNLGGLNDGPLRKYAVFPSGALVHAPASLNALQNSTLPCAALTAWNALFAIEGRELKAGDWVLAQGTGGVSMFAIQFALAVGAHVIATTSSNSKAEKLKALGVQHVINYRTDPTWGETAKKLTPGARGVQHVIEVGGDETMVQSFKAVATEGVISIIGFLASGEQKATMWDTFISGCIVRGINVGSRVQFQEMNRFIEEKKITPVVDERVFEFEKAREAFDYLRAQQFFGKVVIKVSEE